MPTQRLSGEEARQAREGRPVFAVLTVGTIAAAVALLAYALFTGEEDVPAPGASQPQEQVPAPNR
ncbi:MAG: hypothetical protein H6883_13520 [Rhodobiaceae bacterium]|nr:hypothetical protein [Rhodobiaceae bacterium]MCC0057136.1 hypothetical protein [Rhodobiaceae bacterium]